MIDPSHSRITALKVFAAIFAVALAWALYTNHAWEDYYITYRASKNLATGHGLTFTEGERVHSFTSPLGVLLPALASVLTGNSSDDGALWVFRVMSIGAMAGAGVLLWKIGRATHRRGWVAVLLVGLFATDTKIVDFSTNGMETGILMLFLAWTLFALLLSPKRPALHLGLAWAGLMWTRPDSFVYIGALAVGGLLFAPLSPGAPGRGQLLKTFLVAGAFAAAAYGPWLVWAWSYYGTPLPHTITAKGLFHTPITTTSLLTWIWNFPRAVTAHLDMLATTFMPPYSSNTGWPLPMLKATYWIAWGCLWVWVLPGIQRATRFASFAFFAGEFYLTSFVNFPVPWYVPTLTVFSLLVITGLIGQVADYAAGSAGTGAVSAGRKILRWVTMVAAGALAAGALSITVLAAHQLRLQERLIERGERQVIGEWLRDNASSPRDTVFLEPLGYIGFYSNLKMYDFPGLSSPEVVAARKRIELRNYPECWPQLIHELAPDWVVVRDYEADVIRRKDPTLLNRDYSLARIFDVRPAVNALTFVAGRGYLLNDAYFEVYRRKYGSQTNRTDRVGRIARISAAMLEENKSWSGKAYDSGDNLIANAPSRVAFRKPAGARWLVGSFGIFEGAFKDPVNATDGADFRVFVSTGDPATRRLLFHRFLNPRDDPADRSLQAFSIELPTQAVGTIELEITPGPNGNDAYDWTYWSGLAFENPRRE